MDTEKIPKDWSFTSHIGADLRGIDLSADCGVQFLIMQIWKVQI